MRYIINYENKIKEMYEKDTTSFYYIETMGCALNENDTLKYRGILEKSGFRQTNNIDDATIIVFNTCAIRENAEEKLYGRLGQLKKKKLQAKQEGKDIYICIVGCMSEQQHVPEFIKKSYSFVDIVLGTKSMHCFAEKLYTSMKNKQKTLSIQQSEDDIVEGIPIAKQEGYKASVSIIYGCNNFCSYCIVPYVRGRERSRNPEDIVEDIKSLALQGYKEITLLGQNVNSYGNDFKDKKYSFVDLLKDIDKVEGIEIIKFVSPHPKDFSDELIDYIADNKKIYRQIHLPLQSGNTEVLKNMNRKYTKEQYLELTEKMKIKIPDVSFSTDIIVGFPGETEEQFKDTLDVVEKVKFDMIYMFCYSIRKGTRAEKMSDQVEETEKVRRLEILKGIYERILNEKNEQKVGSIEMILLEGKSKNNENKYSGRTKDNKVVILDATEEDVGKIIKVKITKNNKWYLTAEKI